MSISSAQTKNHRIDRLGLVASSLCAVHCALGAWLPVAFGALGLGALLGHEAEWVFTLVAVAFAGGALAIGWRTHRSASTALLLSMGIVGLLASRGLEMSTPHNDGDDPRHHGAIEHAKSPHDHDDHEQTPHLAGTLVGIFAGLLLLLGHANNIRLGVTRRKRDPRSTC